MPQIANISLIFVSICFEKWIKVFFSFPGCFIPVPANLSFEIEPQNDVTLSLVFTDNPGQKKERRQDENKEKLRENCFKIKCHFESSHSTY